MCETGVWGISQYELLFRQGKTGREKGYSGPGLWNESGEAMFDV
jgi:hypothetical protein